MGNLLAYSGLTAKVKAMQSRLITPEQMREMAALGSVTACVEYLKRHPSYAEPLGDAQSGELHRGAIEQYLKLSEYQDFAKLYRFSNLTQRKFLDFYFIHYEVAFLKRYLRSLISHTPLDLNLSVFQQFFDRHSSLNFTRIMESKSLTDFIAALEGSVFYPAFANLNCENGLSLFDCENILDMFYFKTMWRIINKKLKPADRNILIQCFGSRLDMLNIQWLYRCKQFYRMASSEIYAMLIPIQYRLKASDIRNMAESETMDGFFSALKNSRYGDMPGQFSPAPPHPEVLARQVNEHIYQYTSQKNPYSIAVLNTYLYRKEQEIQRLITLIESIRYGVPSQTIIDSLTNSFKGGLIS